MSEDQQNKGADPFGPGTSGLTPYGIDLDMARPNPFAVTTELSFRVARARSNVRLAIYDAQGRLIRTLFDGEAPPGLQASSWDGRDDRQRPVAAGVYLAVLEGGGERRSTKLVVTR